ncbi:MAG: hypothetical protein C5B48_10080 [Candidatus Rokuibacteriota bacterium]|nr:MAG: hypothetical protein C5B48_10080 [Candidatus Rokubacteria bacterium]
MRSRSFRRIVLALLVSIVLVGPASTVASARPTAKANGLPYPNSMAAIGDSWTAAYCTDSDCTAKPADSWSTGTNPAVDSQYQRILAKHPAIKGHNLNIAYQADTIGPGVADLAFQAAKAIAYRPDYITIALGENDVCGPASPRLFGTEFNAGMSKLVHGLPHASIFVASIEDLTHQWRVLDADPKLRPTLSLDCGLSAGLVTKRMLRQLRKRIRSLNRELAVVCGKYRQCRYDGAAVFNIAWKEDDFSPLDRGHLSIEGQRMLAATTWTATYQFFGK